MFGLTGNINGTLYGVSGSTAGLYSFTTSPYSTTFIATLGGGPWGATQKSEGAGTVCIAAPDLDYSDAPADGGSAPDGSSTLAYGEASHTVVSGILLGTTVTDENSAVEDADNASDNGVDLSGLVRGSPKLITVHAPFTNGTNYLQGWIDWNGDGDFADAGEQVAADLRDDGNGIDGTFNDGQIQVMLNVPVGAVSNTWARFRYSSDSGLGSTGTASDGEVEDHMLVVGDYDYGDAPDTATGTAAYNYETLFENNGPGHGINPDLYIGAAPADADASINAPAYTSYSSLGDNLILGDNASGIDEDIQLDSNNPDLAPPATSSTSY